MLWGATLFKNKIVPTLRGYCILKTFKNNEIGYKALRKLRALLSENFQEDFVEL